MNAAFTHYFGRKYHCRPMRLGALWLAGLLLAAGVLARAGEPRRAQIGFGSIHASCAGQPIRNRSWTFCGFTLLADTQGPQVALMRASRDDCGMRAGGR